MRKLKNSIRAVMNYLYWTNHNRKFQSKVYNYQLYKGVKVGRKAMIRNHTEIGWDVSIGDYSYISGPINYIEAATIGKFCSIARQTVIGVGDHNYNWATTHPFITSTAYDLILQNQPAPQKPPPIIGNDVWVGINAVIARGVVIGDGAVIAAGSVVTKDVAAYSIVGGIPAKHIKYRFKQEIIEALLRIKWWDWSDEKLKMEAPNMYHIEDFVRRNDVG